MHRQSMSESYVEIDRKITINGYRIDTFLQADGTQQTYYSLKSKLEHMDCREYSIRIGLATEQYLHGIPPTESLGQHRFIRRFSYQLTPGLRLDLSVVTSGGNDTYEVELELVPPFRPPNEMLETFLFAVEKLVSYFQDTMHPVSNTETGLVKDHIMSVLSIRRFSHAYGCQPRTFQRRDLALLSKPYAVCVKTDGVRCYMFVSSEGHIWLFHRQKDCAPDGMRLFVIGRAIVADGPMIHHSGTLIEGELDDAGFHAFDTLVLENRDLRGDPNELLPKRLNYAKMVIADALLHTDARNMSMKEMCGFPSGDAAEIGRAALRLNAENPGMEGLVFTPMEPYPVPVDEDGHVTRIWSNLLKFKAPGAITIDLRVSLLGSRRHPGLYVILNGREVPFRPKQFPQAGDLEALRRLPTVEIRDEDIVECFYEVVTDKPVSRLEFIPLRIRQDKTVPNAMFVGLDNLHAAVVETCTLDDIQHASSAAANGDAIGVKRTDEFWLSESDFDSYEQNLHLHSAGSGRFPNAIKAIRLPSSGIAGAIASLAPPPPPERVLPPPPPVTPTAQLTEKTLMAMKVTDLKVECRARGLAVKGVRDDLRARLRPFVIND